ncbi:DUF1659 domain-containing protein [Inediibacterium massiliense]|uniref:DUF1659 domain-containing protein n=1 Tax=Inediibacterium massiliense TaxID=1658111 RepID=UPI0006B609EC|nr:DUF1659 domain-containing protein [Inediibacterium massiliense]
MAVNVNLAPSKLKVIFSNGVDENGKEKKRSKTYPNVKPTATDEDLYNVALTLIDLQENEALEVGRVDEKEISQGA